MRPRPGVTAPRVRCDPALVESVVDILLGQQGSGAPDFARFRRAADRIYALYPAPEERRAAFGVLYALLFEELGCARAVAGALKGAAVSIDEVLVVRAWSPSEEGAELSDDRRRVGLRILPARFASEADLQRFLHHELGHVADMLDPAFAYGSGVPGGAARPAPLVAARFGCLWDCSVDGRIDRRGGPPLHTREALEGECARLFPSLPPEAVATVVGRLWEGERPAYPALLDWATAPQALAAWAGWMPERRGPAAPARQGAACPLCGFPTYDWAGSIEDATAGFIKEDFPAWRPVDGACARCVEVYQIRAAAGGAARAAEVGRGRGGGT